MAIGGKVKGNCLECPFHQWSFDGEGACSAIRYQPKVPSTARTRAYSVCEFYGMICVWFGPIGEEEEVTGISKTIVTPVPDYYPPALVKIDKGNMVLRGSTRLTVNMHLQEVRYCM
jgi:cholesterol 7-desaturase